MKIRVFETFAGIGSQNKALQILKKNNILEFEVVATSEWDIWANIAYNSIHHDGENIAKDLTDDEINNFLSQFTHSFDSKKPTPQKSIENRERLIRELLYSAIKNSNNLGSILNITGEKLISETNGVDLITYSFPCQDLSVAGSFHGFNQGMAKGSGTRSGLLWEIERILSDLEKIDRLPKFLLLENVKNMISERHVKDYEMWLNRLNKFGYNTQTFQLKSSDHGSPQIRERVYALSVLGEKSFIDTFKTKKRIIESKNIPDTSKKYNISKKMSDILNVDYSIKKNLLEASNCTPNRTPSRERMFFGNPLLYTKNSSLLKLHNKRPLEEYQHELGQGLFLPNCRTITTKQDRHPNAGIIDLRKSLVIKENEKRFGVGAKAKYRFISPREAYCLMGFESNDYDKVVNDKMLNKEILYRQAGNSIVVNVLVSIFDYMNKWNKE